jgi:hypothetical protein
MGHHVERDVAESMFAAWERWDLDTIGATLAEDAVDERPQSGGRFVGRANIMGMYRQVPGPPQISWRSIRGGPPCLWVAKGTVEYGEAPVHLCRYRRIGGGAGGHSPLPFRRAFRPAG